jgi:hypothetical protein
MVTTLDDTKRTAVAAKLAGMRAMQELLIEDERRFLADIRDDKVRKRLQDMLEDDQKNLGVLDTVIVQYGVRSEAPDTVTGFISKVKELMSGSKLSLYEKVFQHELLKHQQVMTGLVIHKASQKVRADVEAAIGLSLINFGLRWGNQAAVIVPLGLILSLIVATILGSQVGMGLS